MSTDEKLSNPAPEDDPGVGMRAFERQPSVEERLRGLLKGQTMALVESWASARPSFEEMFMFEARLWAIRSVCLSRKVGAVIVQNDHVVATGYNGPPAGFEHCAACARAAGDVAPGAGLDECPALHAEQNAIGYASRFRIRTEGSRLYVTCQPCAACAKLIVTAGIREAVYLLAYPSAMAERVLRGAGVEYRPIFGTGAGEVLGGPEGVLLALDYRLARCLRETGQAVVGRRVEP